MRNLVSRSTFAYSAILFAVLFAPLVGKDPNDPRARTLSALPDGITIALIGVVVFFCVRQSLEHRPAGEPRFRRGLLFASITCAIAGALDGLAVAGLGPTFVPDARAVSRAALGTPIAVWACGTIFAAVFAFILGRPTRGPSPERTVHP